MGKKKEPKMNPKIRFSLFLTENIFILLSGVNTEMQKTIQRLNKISPNEVGWLILSRLNVVVMFDVCIDFSRIHRGKVDCVVCSLLSSAFPFKTGYVKSIPSTEHHKNGYWWRRRCVWVAASVFLKKIRCALHTIYSSFMNFKSVICGEFPKLPPR